MKKTIALFLSAAVAAVLSGCVGIETVDKKDLNGQTSNLGQPVAHINAQNWGLYLLTIPLLTGSTDSVGSIAVMKDTVNAESMVPVVTAESKKLGATKTLDLASQYSVSGLLFYFREINVSANAVK